MKNHIVTKDNHNISFIRKPHALYLSNQNILFAALQTNTIFIITVYKLVENILSLNQINGKIFFDVSKRMWCSHHHPHPHPQISKSTSCRFSRYLTCEKICHTSCLHTKGCVWVHLFVWVWKLCIRRYKSVEWWRGLEVHTGIHLFKKRNCSQTKSCWLALIIPFSSK